MIKWILFDLAGVIVEMYWGNLKRVKINGRIIKTKDLRSIYESKEFFEFMKGDVSEDEVIEVFLRTSRLNLSKNEIKRIMSENIAFIKGMPKILEELKKKYKLSLATNDGREWVQYKIDKLNLKYFFSEVVESNKLKILKQHEGFFQETLKIVKAKPEECVFVDDKKRNCEGAERLGIKSIHFKNSRDFKSKLKQILK